MEIASSFPFVFITKELGNVRDEEFRVVFQLLIVFPWFTQPFATAGYLIRPWGHINII